MYTQKMMCLCITIVCTYLQAAEVGSFEIVATVVPVELGMCWAVDEQWEGKLLAAFLDALVAYQCLIHLYMCMETVLV